uniref:Uncharacterized protein n=1 Tax=Onchocerca volvulus TaxID=6282 RepID=A0A8R1XSN6_ONCVO
MRRLKMSLPDLSNASYEQQGNLYITRNQVLTDKIDRVQLCTYETWLAYIQTITITKKRDEEEKIFESVPEGEKGLFRIMHEGQKAIITLTRPCIFCTQDHWNSECDVYPTVKSRMKRLKSLKKCAICFKDSHKTELCKAKKKCFYCKGLHLRPNSLTAADKAIIKVGARLSDMTSFRISDTQTAP